VFRARGNRSRAARGVIAGAILLALVYLPLWRAYFFELKFGLNIRHSFVTAVLLGCLAIFNTFVSESVAPWILPLGIPACLCIAACLFVVWKYSPTQARRFLLYALLLTVAMTAGGIISSKRFLPIAAWILLPAGVTLGTLPPRRSRGVLVASLVAVMLVGWFGIFSRKYYSAPRFIEPWQTVAAEAADHSRSGALIIGNNPSFFFYLAYALHPPGSHGGSEMLQHFPVPGVYQAGDWIEQNQPLRREVFFVRGAPGPLTVGPAWEAQVWLDAHCHLIAAEMLLPDSGSRLKARFVPEIGDMPWRIRTRDYSCAATTIGTHDDSSTDVASRPRQP
jgi:hypothetical protein